MQYRTGTISLANGSAVVSGVGTQWLTHIQPGALFAISGQPGSYTVLSVASDTQLTLTTPWQGTNVAGAKYWITTDFTPFHNLPVAQPNDLDSTKVIERALLMIDEKIVPAPMGLFAVLDKDLTVPPTNPSEGAAYIVPPGAIGAWANRTSRIALYQRGAWLFYTPSNAAWLKVQDEGKFYFYDLANNTWELNPLASDAANKVSKTGDTMTGVLRMPTGAFNAPTLTFANDTDTGIYSPGANSVGIAVGGQQGLEVRLNGSVRETIIRGDLYVEGQQFVTNTTTVELDDNIIRLNKDVTATPTENGGIEIERGTSLNAQLLWDESLDVWRSGVSGSMQTLATRVDSPFGYGVAFWNPDLKAFEARSTLLFNGTTLFGAFDGTFNGTVAGLQASLDSKLNVSAYTAADVLTKLKTVDGAGSGLDADTVRGFTSDQLRSWSNIIGAPTTFTPSAHTHAAADVTSGTFADARIPTLAISKTSGLQAALDAKLATSSAPVHSQRDFLDGTLVTTDISYPVASGPPIVLEIDGNSYGSLVPFHTRFQAYVYNNTLINMGGYSVGTNIPGIVALSVGGKLCFWWPRMVYWQGFNVKIYFALTNQHLTNQVLAITNAVKPTGTNEIDVSALIRQSWDSGNFNPANKLDTSAFTWAGLSGKPTTFTPSSHVHAISDVSGLQAALDTTVKLNATTTQNIGGYGLYLNNGRGLSMGYSGGNYGGIGYNVNYTTTSDQHIAPGGDNAARMDVGVAGGIVVYGDGGGAAGRTVAWQEVFRATLNQLTYKGSQIWHAGNFNPADKANAVHSHDWAQVTGRPNWMAGLSYPSAGGEWLRHQNASGYIDFGPANAGYAHIYTDRPSFYLNKPLFVNNGESVWTSATFNPALKANLHSPTFSGNIVYGNGNEKIIIHQHAGGITFTPSTADGTDWLWGNDLRFDRATSRWNFSDLLNVAGHQVWTAGTFNPDTKANLSGATFTGAVINTNNSNAAGPNFISDTTNKDGGDYGFVVRRSGTNAGGILNDGRGHFAANSMIASNIIVHAGNISTYATWAAVSGKPTTFTPSAHTHVAADVTSGTFADARIPTLAISKTSGLQAALDAKATLGGNVSFADVTANRIYLAENVTQSVLNPNMGQTAMFGANTTTLGGIITDRLAFTPPTTAQWSTDGTNFTSITVPTGIFKGMISNQWGGFNIPASVQKVRFTWSPLGYIFMDDFVAACSTNGRSVRFVFEKSADGTTWLPYFTSAWTSTWPGYITHKLNDTPSSSHQHFRITVECNQANSNDITIGCLSIMSSYGGSSPLYTWDESKNFFLQGSGQFYANGHKVYNAGDWTVSTSANANTVAQRNGLGYLSANWFDANNGGMYSSASGVHFQISEAWGASLYANQTTVQLQMRTAGGISRGSVYADNANVIGFLNNDGNWALQIPKSGSASIRVNGELRTIWTSENFNPDTKLNTTGGTINGALSVHNNSTTTQAATVEISRADDGVGTGPIYLRFHHYNRWWRRIKADNGGFSLVGGSDENLQELRAAGVFCNGNRVWDAGHFNAPTVASGVNTPVLRDGSGDINLSMVRFDNIRKGLIGVYSPSQTQAIWAMGADYTLPSTGASNNYGNHYGLAWSYDPDYGGAGNNPQSKTGLLHQMLVQMYGVTQTAIGQGIWTSGRVECAGNGGWTMGSYSGKNRIDYDGSKFRFLNSGNAFAHVEMNNLTSHGAFTAANGNVWTEGSLIYSSQWWRSTGATGWFNSTYSTGIWSTQAGEVRTYNGSRFHSEGQISAEGVIIASQAGFQSATYAYGRNRIWSFANADNYGLSYFQGGGGWEGVDTIGLHFGDASAVTSSQHRFNASGNAFHSGNMTVGSWSVTSDRRLKSNFETVENTGELIDATNVVSFNKRGSKDRHVGVIAQELQATAPHLVRESEEAFEGDTPLLSVDANGLLFTMLAELKSLRKRVAELEARTP